MLKRRSSYCCQLINYGLQRLLQRTGNLFRAKLCKQTTLAERWFLTQAVLLEYVMQHY